MAEQTGKQEGEEQAGSSGMVKKLVFATIALVLVGAGAFAGLMLMGNDTVELDENGDPILADEAEQEAAGDGPVFYTSLSPALIVNFKDRIGDDHVMQVSLDLMARDQATINQVREHIPVVRSTLILLYSDFIYEEVSTLEGKQRMLDDGLSEIRKIMTKRLGKPAVEEIYFTGLVIQ